MPIMMAEFSKSGFGPRFPFAAAITPAYDLRMLVNPRKMLTAVKNVGSAYAARGGRRPGVLRRRVPREAQRAHLAAPPPREDAGGGVYALIAAPR